MKTLLTLAFALSVMQLAPAFAAAPKKAVASPEVQKEFEGFITKFRVAVKANDPAAVATMTRLPFMAEDSVRDAAQFRAKIYATSFTAKKRSCLLRSKAIYDRDGNNNDSYAIFCGDDIFVFTKTPSGFLFTDISVND
ncbi:hypothetical protein PY365_21540 [Roseiarcaceae bacterium H3SJ34-1]|uniref:hypothetical protein n=1 Tax=Terripilifer ovatus TaxID=3032367 RepID=UPI003AB92E6F|nr:hypothetical protein [Roseiarcaceae bacterium H3SJ34-1]